jgi:hypothetical protein
VALAVPFQSQLAEIIMALAMGKKRGPGLMGIRNIITRRSRLPRGDPFAGPLPIKPPCPVRAPAKHEPIVSIRCFVGEGLIPSRAWESRIQISCCRPGWVREGINPSPTKGWGFLSLSSIYFHIIRIRNRPAGLALLALMGGIWLFAVLGSPLYAEEKDSIFGESGIHYPGGFDPNTVGSVQGKASHFTRPEKGPVYFQLASGRETFTVLASPAWYWNDSHLKVSDGTEMIVRGSKSYGKDGRLYIVAEEIRLPATGQTASFREPNGIPLWKGSGRSFGGGSGGFGSSGGRGGFGGGLGGGGRGRR